MPERLSTLLPVLEEVAFHVGGQTRAWLRDEAQALYSTAEDMMDVARGPDDYGPARRARGYADTAIGAMVGRGWQLSTAVVNIIRAWTLLKIHDDPIREMRTQLLGLLHPVDAMAFLGREEATDG